MFTLQNEALSSVNCRVLRSMQAVSIQAVSMFSSVEYDSIWSYEARTKPCRLAEAKAPSGIVIVKRLISCKGKIDF